MIKLQCFLFGMFGIFFHGDTDNQPQDFPWFVKGFSRFLWTLRFGGALAAIEGPISSEHRSQVSEVGSRE
jgi:hypothetical protein